MALSLSPPRPEIVTPAWRENLEALFICVSLGNLCFLPRWYELEHLKEPAMDYYRVAPANPALLTATVVSALLLAALFWSAWYWMKRWPAPAKLKLAQCGFLFVMIYPFESVRRYWNTEGGRPDVGTNIALVAIEAILVLGLILVLFGNIRILRAARKVVLLLTLLFPALVMDFTWARLGAAPASAFAAKPSLPMLAKIPQRRVVWLLFDELDQRLAFDLRQPAVDLPELDRLRAESLVATGALQTANWTTMALPCLLSGRLYSRVDLINVNTVRVYREGSATGEDWRDQPNLFKRARELGVNAELVGWHHPYCRVLGGDMVRCLDVLSQGPTTALIHETDAGEQGTVREIVSLFRQQGANLIAIFHPGGEPTTNAWQDQSMQHRQQQQYFRIRDRAYADIADPRIGLLFAHFPAPHLFGIYDRKRKDFTLSDTLTYADNLALVDRTVGEIRKVLEQAGLWESTTLLITADHGLRPDVWRGHMGWTDELERLTGRKQSETVPFILKLPGETRGIVYEQPFSSVVSGDLILAVLNGQISTYQETSEWLATRAGSEAFVR